MKKHFLSCELQIIREDQILLVLMDVQKGYLEGSTWAIPHGRDAHPMNIAFQRIVRLLERLNDEVKVMSVQYIGPQFVNDTDKELIDPLIEQILLVLMESRLRVAALLALSDSKLVTHLNFTFQTINSPKLIISQNKNVCLLLYYTVFSIL
jgi:hypothetical protein